MSQDKKFIFKGTVYNVLGIIPKVISPVLVIMMARFFSQEEFGLFISIKFFIMTLSRLVVFGLDKGLVWFIPQNQQHGRPTEYNLIESYYFTSFISLFVTALCILFVYFGGLVLFPAIPQSAEPFVYITLFSLLPLMGLHCFSAALEGFRKPQYKIFLNQFFIESIGPIISIALFYFLSIQYSLAWGYTISNYIGLFIYLYLIHKIFTIKWMSFSFPSKALFNYSIPIGVSEVINSMLLRVDLWMILAFLGPKSAAIYSIMIMLTNAIKTVRQGYDPLVLAVVAKMNKGDQKKQLKNVFSYTTNIITTIQILIAFGVLFFPKEIMLIAGKEYTVNVQALAILLFGNLISGFFGLNAIVLLGLGKSLKIMNITIITLFINFGLNFILIPKYGIAGAATATIFTQFIGMLYSTIMQYRQTHVFLYEKHLITNALFILIIAIVSFGYFDTIQEYSIVKRAGMLAISVAITVIVSFLKKSTFKHA